jgi:hypothetical protein
LAACRRRQAAQDAQQTGLAAAVAAFDVQPTARWHGKAHALEQGPLGLLAGEVHRSEHPRRHKKAFRSVEDKAKCNDRLTLCVLKALIQTAKSGYALILRLETDVKKPPKGGF